MSTTYRADWVFTGKGEPIRNGVVEVFQGRVKSITPWRSGDHVTVDLGQSLITPGYHNAHCHLDLGALSGKLATPGQFTDWLRQVVTYRRQGNVAEWDNAIVAGIAESLGQGTVWMNDISVGGRSEPLLAQSPLLANVCLELIGMSDSRVGAALDEAKTWLETESPLPVRSLSPHAPYTVAHQLLAGLCEMNDVYYFNPVMHVAETREEIELLEERSGPFIPFLQELGAWQPDNLIGSIDDLLEQLTTFQAVSLIHCNYLTQAQWQRLKHDTVVVYCPRTHAYFGHEPHPYLDMLVDGVSIALGTDSLASNPDLSILNECRFLWHRDRSRLTGSKLLELGTQHSQLQTDRPAHFVVIPHDGYDKDPWELLWSGNTSPAAVYINGVAI
jgi:cytosine/adenosine deaminase-related metal-dependent hydrolase